jgi:hypothetical protein
MKVHYVYQIENLIDGKIYIGKHTTSHLEDGYMGRGKLLIKAIEKYGIENFKKTVLSFFETEEEAFQYEKILVTEEFVKREDTYNLTCGGSGSWYATNKNEDLRKEKNKRAALSRNRTLWNDPEWRERATKRASDLWKKLWEEGKLSYHDWTGLKHKAESREKMSRTHKRNDHQKGEKNSNYGNIWIYNLSLKESKRIPSEELQNYLDTGWIKGRKMSW